MSYEPKEGTGWEEGSSVFGDVRRWQTRLDEETWLRVTVTAGASMFVIGRVRGNEHAPPRLEDVARIEREFGVRAWEILGVVPALMPASGSTLVAQAVER